MKLARAGALIATISTAFSAVACTSTNVQTAAPNQDIPAVEPATELSNIAILRRNNNVFGLYIEADEGDHPNYIIYPDPDKNGQPRIGFVRGFEQERFEDSSPNPRNPEEISHASQHAPVFNITPIEPHDNPNLAPATHYDKERFEGPYDQAIETIKALCNGILNGEIDVEDVGVFQCKGTRIGARLNRKMLLVADDQIPIRETLDVTPEMLIKYAETTLREIAWLEAVRAEPKLVAQAPAP